MITHDFGHTSEKRMTVSIIIGSIIIASSCIGIKIYQDSYPTHEVIATPNKKLQEKYYLNKNDKSKSSNFINDLNKSANNLNNAATEKKPDK